MYTVLLVNLQLCRNIILKEIMNNYSVISQLIYECSSHDNQLGPKLLGDDITSFLRIKRKKNGKPTVRCNLIAIE